MCVSITHVAKVCVHGIATCWPTQPPLRRQCHQRPVLWVMWLRLGSWDKVIVQQNGKHQAMSCIVWERVNGPWLHGLGKRRWNGPPQPFKWMLRHCSNVGITFLMLTP